MKIVLIVLGVLVLIGGGYWLLSGSRAGTALDTSALTETTTQTISSATSTSAATIATNKIMRATLTTSMGDIVVEFYPDQAPKTVENFIKLAQQGFYDGTKFHRVIKGFMDQGGDPNTKDAAKMAQWGMGGPGYTIADEFGMAHPNVAGTIAMANTGAPNSGGSQFFINAVDNHFLDGKYSVFGHVVSGMDVVAAINNTPTDSSDRPLTPVVLEKVTVTQ